HRFPPFVGIPAAGCTASATSPTFVRSGIVNRRPAGGATIHPSRMRTTIFLVRRSDGCPYNPLRSADRPDYAADGRTEPVITVRSTSDARTSTFGSGGARREDDVRRAHRGRRAQRARRRLLSGESRVLRLRSGAVPRGRRRGVHAGDPSGLPSLGGV